MLRAKLPTQVGRSLLRGRLPKGPGAHVLDGVGREVEDHPDPAVGQMLPGALIRGFCPESEKEDRLGHLHFLRGGQALEFHFIIIVEEDSPPQTTLISANHQNPMKLFDSFLHLFKLFHTHIYIIIYMVHQRISTSSPYLRRRVRIWPPLSLYRKE